MVQGMGSTTPTSPAAGYPPAGGLALEAVVVTLRRFAAAAARAVSADELADALAEAFHDALGPDQVHLSEISQDHRVGVSWISARDGDGVARPVERYVQELDGRASGLEAVVASGTVLHVPDAHASGVLRQDHVERWACASALFLPVRVREEVRAVAILMTQAPRTFTSGEIAAGEALAEVAGGTLARLDVRGGQEESGRSAAVARAARALTSSLELNAVLNAVCREAALALHADMASVYLGDGQRGGVAVGGHGVAAEWIGRTIKPGEGVGGQVLVTGRSVFADDYRDTRRPDMHGDADIRTAVSVPMRWDGELRGAVSVAFNRMRRIGDEDLAVLEAIAELAALACQNAEAYGRARAAARTDPLTGVLNHGAMQGRITLEIDNARTAGTPLTLLLIDLDNFKALNDRHGHQAGDRFLREVATALAGAARGAGGLARYGGDEFVLVLPGCEVADAIGVGERLCDAVRGVGRRAGDGEAMGASVGAAAWCEPLTGAELLERADRALLLAKRSGKARVAVAGAETDEQLALLEARAGIGPGPVRELWDAVAADPARALEALPPLLRRQLDLEECALYEVAAGETALRRTAFARHPGNPSPTAFRAEPLVAVDGRTGGDVGALWRTRLPELLSAFHLTGLAGAPSGAYAGIPLVRAGRLHGLLLLRASAGTAVFPADALARAELLSRQAVLVLAGRRDGSPAAVRALAAASDARDA